MADDAKSTILSFWLISFALYVLTIFVAHPISYILFGSALVVSLFSLFFFRDPVRNIPNIPDVLVSPADGKILTVNKESNYPGSDEKCSHIAIFLNLHDVHVNRIPFDGKISTVEYKPGKFLKAFDPEANNLNEQYKIELQTSRGKFVILQIAGLIARRLVCRLIPGQDVSAGEKFGLMKFSSRIDLYFSCKFNIEIEIGQKVRGGESILARFIDGEE